MKLVKLSGIGWEKVCSPGEARELLYKYICNQCREEEGITEQSSIVDMLATACGCEFDVESD